MARPKGSRIVLPDSRGRITLPPGMKLDPGMGFEMDMDEDGKLTLTPVYFIKANDPRLKAQPDQEEV